MRNSLTRLILLAALVGVAGPVNGEVTRVDIAKRTDVGTSGYEKIVGTIHFAVDPGNPRNRVIVDLDAAKKNAAGRVEFSADLYILRPRDQARSNGVALVEVSNRGRKSLLSTFNRGPAELDPSKDADLGDGFLTQQGYTLVWVGWQFDVPRQGGLMKLDAPATTVTGVVRAEFTTNDRALEQTVADLAGYSPSDPAAGDATLTVRDGPFGTPTTIPRGQWRLRGSNVVSIDGGFEPGRTYEVSYRAANLPVVAAGLAAFRDTAAWIKYSPDATVSAKQAYTFGASQSGRFLRAFLYYGFNSDEQGRQVFDGVMAHIAGAGRLSINEARGATPNALSMYNATRFPFSDAAQRDPNSGRTEGLLDNDRARQNQPKIFYTNTGVEYWGGGRAAALVHTTLDGKSDLTPPDNVRVYFLTGTQHSPSRFPPRMTSGQQLDNPVEYAWTLRALLTGMDRWVRQGTAPPASQHPRLADRSLVAGDHVAFPAIPGVASPRTIPAGRDGAVVWPLLVPQVDEDGNERAGIRAPVVAVPLATYTGWNFRSPAIGGPTQLVSLLGSSIPFARTRPAREAARDPRRSIDERYPSIEAYLARIREAGQKLVEGRYLLAEDLSKVVERAREHWDLPAMTTSSR
jgi:alpha/beta hydrolase family protein